MNGSFCSLEEGALQILSQSELQQFAHHPHTSHSAGEHRIPASQTWEKGKVAGAVTYRVLGELGNHRPGTQVFSARRNFSEFGATRNQVKRLVNAESQQSEFTWRALGERTDNPRNSEKEISAKQIQERAHTSQKPVSAWQRGGRGGKGGDGAGKRGGGGKGEEMTQTLYAHINKKIK
jgi:hypothetical protein